MFIRYLKRFRTWLFADITTIPKFLESPHYSSLDGLRGLSILMVIFAHFGINRFLKPYRLLIDSSLGVHIFFVLSGFLITTLLLKEKIKRGKISLTHFYLRRILRIVPVSYLFLFALIGLNFFYQLKITPIDFIASFFFLKNVPIGNSPFTAHFWSLAVEMQFYVTFPILLASNINRYFIIAILIAVLIPLISILGFYKPEVLFVNNSTKTITKILMYSFWNGPVIILIGSIFSILAFKGIIKFDKLNSNYYSGFILLLIAILVHTKTFFFYSKYGSEHLSACIIGYVILLGINGNNLLSLILNNSVLVKIGRISYSLYIWQELLIGSLPWQPWFKSWIGFPLGIIIVLKMICVFLLANASYHLVESKFLKLKKQAS
jgi:peptidoglycan/LPS O-acetylase OafA/YrhL